MKKVAVCISGALKGDLSSLDNIYQYVVKPLNADVFLTTWDNHYLWSEFVNLNVPHVTSRFFGDELASVLPFQYQFGPEIIKLFPSSCKKMSDDIIIPTCINSISKKIDNISSLQVFKEEEFTNYIKTNFGDFLSQKIDTNFETNTKQINQFKMHFLLNACDNLLSNYELASNYNYDYVIRIRPDITLRNGPLFNGEILNIIGKNDILVDLYDFGVSDAFFICQRASMKKICSFWKIIKNSKKLSPFCCFPYASNHFLLFLAILYYGLDIIPANQFDSMRLENLFLSQKKHFPAFDELLHDLLNCDLLKQLPQYKQVENYVVNMLNFRNSIYLQH